MKYPFWLTLMLSLTLAGGVATAQYPFGFKNSQWGQPYTKPPVSPYVNLTRPGASPAFNYATLVQPQLKIQQNIQGLQNQVNTVQQSVGTLEQQTLQGPPLLPATGHPVGFLTHKSYFMNPGG